MGTGRNSNSFKLLCLALLPARMMKIHPKMKALDCSEPIKAFKAVLVTFKNEKDPIKNEIARAFIVVLVTCKIDEDSFKNESIRTLTTFLQYKSREIFSDVQGQLTLAEF